MFCCLTPRARDYDKARSLALRFPGRRWRSVRNEGLAASSIPSHFALKKYPIVDLYQSFGSSRWCELDADSLPGSLSHARSDVVISKHLADRICQSSVNWGDEQPCRAIYDDLGQSSHVRGHYGDALRHRLGHAHSKSLLGRGVCQQVEAAVKAGDIFDPAEERNTVADPQCPCLCHKPRPLGAIARDQQHGGRKSLRDGRKCMQYAMNTLERHQSPGRSKDERLPWDPLAWGGGCPNRGINHLRVDSCAAFCHCTRHCGHRVKITQIELSRPLLPGVFLQTTAHVRDHRSPRQGPQPASNGPPAVMLMDDVHVPRA
jgi:hypothetical protein